MSRTITLENQTLDICIHRFRLIKKEDCTLKAVFHLRYGDLQTWGWKIVSDPKDGRVFMAPASYQAKNGRFHDHFAIWDKEIRMRVERMAIEIYAEYIHGEVVDDPLV